MKCAGRTKLTVYCGDAEKLLLTVWIRQGQPELGRITKAGPVSVSEGVFDPCVRALERLLEKRQLTWRR